MGIKIVKNEITKISFQLWSNLSDNIYCLLVICNYRRTSGGQKSNESSIECFLILMCWIPVLFKFSNFYKFCVGTESRKKKIF